MSRKREDVQVRLWRLTRARLSTPTITSLLLLPILPPSQRNLIFEVLPFYRSLAALLSRHPHKHLHVKRTAALQQWLSYWLLYGVLRTCEQTRLIVLPATSSSNSMISKASSAAASTWLAYTRALLSDIASRLPRLSLTHSSIPEPVQTPTTPRSLAAQLAGTPMRWTVIKCVILFWAMDEELQGARWLLLKVIKPIVGFFQSMEDPPEEELSDCEDTPASRQRTPKSRSHRLRYDQRIAASSSADELATNVGKCRIVRVSTANRI